MMPTDATGINVRWQTMFVLESGFSAKLSTSTLCLSKRASVRIPLEPALDETIVDRSSEKFPSKLPGTTPSGTERVGKFIPSACLRPFIAKPPSTTRSDSIGFWHRMRCILTCQSGHCSVGGIRIVSTATARSPQGYHLTLAMETLATLWLPVFVIRVPNLTSSHFH